MPVMSKPFRPQATWSFQTAGILQMFRMKWSPSVTVSPLDLKKASRKVCGLYSMTYIRIYLYAMYVCMCMHSCCKVGHASVHTLLVCGMWVSLYTGTSYQLNPYIHKISLLSVTMYLWYVVLPKTLAKVSQKGSNVLGTYRLSKCVLFRSTWLFPTTLFKLATQAFIEIHWICIRDAYVCIWCFVCVCVSVDWVSGRRCTLFDKDHPLKNRKHGRLYLTTNYLCYEQSAKQKDPESRFSIAIREISYAIKVSWHG